MNKEEYLALLNNGLSGLPQEELEECLLFYTEMIADRMEEGLSEEEAVAAIGPVSEIIRQAKSEASPSPITPSKPKRRLKVWEILLLILGAPLWFSLLVAAFSVIIALLATLWCVVAVLWVVLAAGAGCSLGGLFSGSLFIYQGNVTSGLVMIAGGLVCIGLSIFWFYLCNATTKGAFWLTKNFAKWIGKCFARKGSE